MDQEKLKKKIASTLKRNLFPQTEAYIDVGMGDTMNDLHVLIISREFQKLRESDRHDEVWDVLQSKLKPEEWGTVSLTSMYSPEELMRI